MRPDEAAAYKLADYDLDERTGIATLTYERTVGGVVEIALVNRDENVPPKFGGREAWSRDYLAKAERNGRDWSEMIYDGLVGKLIDTNYYA